MSEPLPPSGQQFEIRYADQRAVVTEVGATIRQYSVAGRPVLDGFEVDQVCSGARGQQLVPWPNRIRDGRYPFAGKTQQLALTEPLKGNAIHGLARWSSWRPVSVDETRVELTVTIHPQPGWTGSLDAFVAVELGAAGLSVTIRARNVGSTKIPYGAGSHPYLTLGADRVDAATLQLPAARFAAPDDRGIPVDLRPVDGTPYDFRSGRPIGDLVLDTAYTDLTRGEDGRSSVVLSDESSSVTVWADRTHSWWQVFTGDTLPPGRARAGLAIEPMTCGPDAFNTGADLVTLQPGDEHTSVWGITPGGHD